MNEFDKTMPMSAAPVKCFRVWMLFAAGSAAEIELTCHREEGSAERPVKVYPLCDCTVACVRAGDKAAEAAYLEYVSRGKGKETFRLGYDLKGTEAGTGVNGGSGGLALALAFYGEIAGAPLRGVAASGEITSLRDGSTIGPVEGITVKLETALTLLAPGDLALYPACMENKISRQLRDRYALQRIELQPVASVSAAIAVLFGKRPEAPPVVAEPKKRFNPTIVLMVLLCLVAAGMFLFWYVSPSWFSSSPPADPAISHSVDASVDHSAPQDGVPEEKESQGAGETHPQPEQPVENSVTAPVTPQLPQLPQVQPESELEPEPEAEPESLPETIPQIEPLPPPLPPPELAPEPASEPEPEYEEIPFEEEAPPAVQKVPRRVPARGFD